MSITVGDIRKGVLHQMREFSNSGQITTTADNKDYLLSIIPLLNIYQRELATTTRKIKRKYEIYHNMPTNQLGLVNWNEDKIHVGGVDDEFISIGSRAYSIQLAGHASALVQEEVAGVWTTRVAINHAPIAGEGYVTYKGLTGIVTSTNRIRILLNSAYRHPYRWVALFSDNFYDASEVPAFEPYVPYLMSTNFFKLDRIQFSYADRQLNNYNAFKEYQDSTGKYILLDWYEKGEFIINYNAYPTIIPDPDTNNPLLSDNMVLDIEDECGPALVHRICAALLRDENSYMSDTFEESYKIAKAELVQNDSFDEGEQGIIINSNW